MVAPVARRAFSNTFMIFVACRWLLSSYGCSLFSTSTITSRACVRVIASMSFAASRSSLRRYPVWIA